MNPLKVLEIDIESMEDLNNLTVDDINTKYKKLAHKFHPDKVGSTNDSDYEKSQRNKKFQQIKDARDELLESKKKGEPLLRFAINGLTPLCKSCIGSNIYEVYVTDPDITGIGTLEDPLVENTFLRYIGDGYILISKK